MKRKFRNRLFAAILTAVICGIFCSFNTSASAEEKPVETQSSILAGILSNQGSALNAHDDRIRDMFISNDDLEALEEEAAAEDENDPKTWYIRGCKYFVGQDVELSFEKAVGCWLKAGEMGSADAQGKLGYCYAVGLGVEQDVDESIRWSSKAAEQGLETAQFNLGLCYEIKEEYEKAAIWYEKAAEQNDPIAQLHMALLYDTGKGVEQDYEKAVEYYTKAAEQGYASAQYNLGACYEYGDGVEQNDEKAAQWYRRAAEQGDADAQFALGVCYDYGAGIEQSFEKAAEWYAKAANQGQAKAQYSLGLLYAYGDGVPQSYEKAAEWYRKSAEQGMAEAQTNLGVLYAEGTGVPQSDTEAVAWFLKAAELGNNIAQFNVGMSYYLGRGINRDVDKSMHWLSLAADQGNEDAAYALDHIRVEVGQPSTGLPEHTAAAYAADDDLLIPRNLAEYYNALLPELIRKVMGISDIKAAAEMQEYLKISFIETKGSVAYYDSPTYEVEIGGYYENGAPMVNNPSDALNIAIVEDLQSLLKEVMCLYVQACDSTIDADALRAWIFSAKETGDRYPLNGYLIALNHANGYWQYALLRDNTAQPEQNIEPQSEVAANAAAQPEGSSGVIFCPECGRKIAAGSKFCMYCGNKIPDISSGNPEPSSGKSWNSVLPGDIIEFGAYEQDNDLNNGQEPVEWVVLDVQDGKALLLSKYALTFQQFHSGKSNNIRWETCSLRPWLNEEFLETAFSSEEQQRILLSEVISESDPEYYSFERAGLVTIDKIFLLSTREAINYLPSESDRKCAPTEYAKRQTDENGHFLESLGTCHWWLRTPGKYLSCVYYADLFGKITDYFVNEERGIRPAMWVNLE